MSKAKKELKTPIYQNLIEQIQAKGLKVKIVEEVIPIGYAAIRLYGADTSKEILLRVNPKYKVIADHAITQQLLRAVRFLDLPEQDRQFPGMTPDAFRVAMTDVSEDMAELLNTKRIPLERYAPMIRHLYDGVVTQVTSMPADLRIEKYIKENMPQLEALQKKSLFKQIQDGAKGLSLEILSLTPKKLYTCNALMNYAYFKMIDQYIFPVEAKYFEVFEGIIDKEMGDTLFQAALNPELNDFQLTKVWVEKLGIEDWFKWIK